jgi:hypothetical protein
MIIDLAIDAEIVEFIHVQTLLLTIHRTHVKVIDDRWPEFADDLNRMRTLWQQIEARTQNLVLGNQVLQGV